tara:strand:+ start:238 stop:534 length:297 start_codon:yes stop_codon:yes gene_type:complete
MGKKSRRRENKEKIVELYTKKEKYNEISKLVTKLEMLGLGVFENEMKKLDEMSQKYMNENIEFREIINLPGSKRKMDIKFINNKKYPISINLLYDNTV